MTKKNCKHCEKEFEITSKCHPHQVFCSGACGTNAWVKLNNERSREIKRKYYNKNKEKHEDYRKEFYQRPEVKEYYRQYRKNTREKYKLNELARRITTSAIKKGHLQPVKELNCFGCDKQAEQYHHDNYYKPLNVTPLCKKCHRNIERVNSNTA